MRSLLAPVLGVFLLLGIGEAVSGELPPDEVRRSLDRAGAYFRDKLGVDGTYVWAYSIDGRIRRGEGGAVPRSVGWAQPPGTPAVGAAFLRIYEVTGERRWLDAAHQVASALVRTQLLSGGWSSAIESDPAKARQWCYRTSGITKQACSEKKANKNRNKTVLDDNTTAGSLNFLIWFDKTFKGSDAAVRDSIDFGLRRLMKVQYRNGAFPAFHSGSAPGAAVKPAERASLPATWSHDWQKPATSPYFLTNDNLPRDTGRLFLNAYRRYGNVEYLKTAVRVGDFLLASQLPAPQQGWAQQYDRDLQPVWGRKFEPPALVSLETAGSIDYLLDLYGQTGDGRYLDGAKSAAVWLTAARQPDGMWARFYELHTNRPLFVDKNDHVTFEKKNLIDHYSMWEKRSVASVLDRLRRLEAGEAVPQTGIWVSDADQLSRGELDARVTKLITSQDADGRWTEDGWIDGRQFVEAVFALARKVSDSAPPGR